MKNVLDNQQRAKNVTIAFYILIAAHLVSIVSDYFEYQLLSKVFFSMEEATSNDFRQILVAILLLGTAIGVIITFIQWFRRAYHNLHKADVKGLTASEGWAAGTWFVPILNLFRPYQIMREIWVETRQYVRKNKPSELSDMEESNYPSVSIIGIWWTLWIISYLLGVATTQISRNSYDIESFKTADILSISQSVVEIINIFVILKIIKESQKMQNKFMIAWRERDNEHSEDFVISESDDILD
ncbi:DUF4328 domain-containing protein [Paracrocinitomix mangrovi]|uniref:DUF4328 domain-containing protein n=1 Tax=Paracrocinitomix mangrovi TaxID=2862509 RepID=UPI001C8E2B24|nr:DUF4328 domain-containing protein [Paracrocinitomix mangrovi]UKN02182.1 DUF4328 domain-containing protein [Paracrocinitomix mangrovi]